MPINGIILCISAKDLYGHEKLSTDALQIRANAIMHTLIKAQTSLRIRLPVYVVVTYCDIIPGFSSLSQALPRQNQGNILGWSSPYDLQYLFTPNWMDEAFHYFDEKIDCLRTELLSLSVDSSNTDSLFVFSKEILTIQERLTSYINRIFIAQLPMKHLIYAEFILPATAVLI
jgi:type VI secretion system protein ImpL